MGECEAAECGDRVRAGDRGRRTQVAGVPPRAVALYIPPWKEKERL